MSAVPLPLALVPEGRRRLLRLLMRLGPRSASEIAEELDLTTSGARQQLSVLEGGGLVTHRSVREGPGRPRHVFDLTEQGRRLFPRRHGELARELLGYLEETGSGAVESLFARRSHRRVEEARRRLRGLPFDERVQELARILDGDGYEAESQRLDDGSWRIVEHNCAIETVARRYGAACSSEIDFLRAALPDAEIVRTSHIASGGRVCAYAIRPRPPGSEDPSSSPS